MNEKYLWKGVASIALCAAGAVSLYVTGDHISPSGMGWIVVGLFVIWG